MTVDEVLDDLEMRLTAAARCLAEMRDGFDDDELTSFRLKGKRQGVQLAIDYLRAYR